MLKHSQGVEFRLKHRLKHSQFGIWVFRPHFIVLLLNFPELVHSFFTCDINPSTEASELGNTPGMAGHSAILQGHASG